MNNFFSSLDVLAVISSQAMKTTLRTLRLVQDERVSTTAANVGLSQSYVRELESLNSKKKPTAEVVQKYAAAYNVSPDDLVLIAQDSDSTFAKILHRTLMLLYPEEFA